MKIWNVQEGRECKRILNRKFERWLSNKRFVAKTVERRPLGCLVMCDAVKGEVYPLRRWHFCECAYPGSSHAMEMTNRAHERPISLPTSKPIRYINTSTASTAHGSFTHSMLHALLQLHMLMTDMISIK